MNDTWTHTRVCCGLRTESQPFDWSKPGARRSKPGARRAGGGRGGGSSPLPPLPPLPGPPHLDGGLMRWGGRRGDGASAGARGCAVWARRGVCCCDTGGWCVGGGGRGVEEGVCRVLLGGDPLVVAGDDGGCVCWGGEGGGVVLAGRRRGGGAVCWHRAKVGGRGVAGGERCRLGGAFECRAWKGGCTHGRCASFHVDRMGHRD